MAGRAWLGGLLHAYVGLLIGTLAAVRATGGQRGPLAVALADRITYLGEAFRQIVAAQFWIATFNTLLTALFLLAILPLWGLRLPYTPALITLTFLAGLVPIVGNLLCNAVITIVGLSVSPTAAIACLAFLVLIHKAEYVINAKVVGQRTHMGVWEPAVGDVRGRGGVRPRGPGGGPALLRLPQERAGSRAAGVTSASTALVRN